MDCVESKESKKKKKVFLSFIWFWNHKRLITQNLINVRWCHLRYFDQHTWFFTLLASSRISTRFFESLQGFFFFLIFLFYFVVLLSGSQWIWGKPRSAILPHHPPESRTAVPYLGSSCYHCGSGEHQRKGHCRTCFKRYIMRNLSCVRTNIRSNWQIKWFTFIHPMFVGSLCHHYLLISLLALFSVCSLWPDKGIMYC